MIVDSSAIVAILLRDRGWEALVTKLGQDPAPAVGALTLAETGIVLTAKLGRNARALLSRFIQEAGLTVVPFDDAHWTVALDAYVRFGKGRHPSALNFGDCLTYATASSPASRSSAPATTSPGPTFRSPDLPRRGVGPAVVMTGFRWPGSAEMATSSRDRDQAGLSRRSIRRASRDIE